MGVIIKKAKAEELRNINFGVKDFMVVKLKKSGNEKVVHKVLGEKLIAAKKATEVKDADLKQTENKRRTVSDVAE